MNRVSLASLTGYHPAEVAAAMAAVLAPLGGMEAFVRPGQRVLIKPNLLAGKPPEKAVTTHPEVVRAVIALVQRAGAMAVVGDSPGIGNCRQVARKSGILAVIEESGAELAPFDESQPVRCNDGTFHHLELARDLLAADVIINLPKLKTHQMMGLTCAVKNMFGAVVGMRKPRLHLQAGTDKAFFARMLLDLCDHLRPALSIVDAGLAMEGDGPGSGDPVWIGALLAGSEPLAVDAVALELLGFRPDSCWTQRVARDLKRPGSRLEEITVVGANPADLRPARFRPAKTTDVNFGLPPFLKNRLKRSLSALPTVAEKECEVCGLCARHCPPEAMQIRENRLRIDHRRCIACFCCQELCPKGAILTRQGLLLRLCEFLSHRSVT